MKDFPGIMTTPAFSVTPTLADVAGVIVKETAIVFKVSPRDIFGRSRKERLVWARHAAIAITREITGADNVKVGAVFRRDNATIHHAMRRFVQADTKAPPGVPACISELRRRLGL